MNVSISQASWFNQDAWILENDTLRTIIVPEMGAKLVSLFDKRTQLEWLVGPGQRPFQKVPYGASFVDQDMSGWDEMFPTITACAYPVPGNYKGRPLPDHGEVWAMPWTLESSSPNSLKLSVTGRALPYRLSRTLRFTASNTLQMHYELENLSQESMPFMWAAHPQFVCGAGAKIILPPYVQEVCNTLPPEWGWGDLERRFAWPEALSIDRQRVRIDHTGPVSLKLARKFFVPPETMVSWAGVVHQSTNDWLRLDWDAEQVPYLGIWIDEGVFSTETVVALEPMTGFYDSLAVAWEKALVTTIDAGAIKSWTMSVRLGRGDYPFDDTNPPVNKFAATSTKSTEVD